MYFQFMAMHVYFHLQLVAAHNGLIAILYSPVEGRRHDAYMLSASGLQPKLARITRYLQMTSFASAML